MLCKGVTSGLTEGLWTEVKRLLLWKHFPNKINLLAVLIVEGSGKKIDQILPSFQSPTLLSLARYFTPFHTLHCIHNLSLFFHFYRNLSACLIGHLSLGDFCIINTKIHILLALLACKLFEKKLQVGSSLYSSPSIHIPNTHTHNHSTVPLTSWMFNKYLWRSCINCGGFIRKNWEEVCLGALDKLIYEKYWQSLLPWTWFLSATTQQMPTVKY